VREVDGVVGVVEGDVGGVDVYCLLELLALEGFVVDLVDRGSAKETGSGG